MRNAVFRLVAHMKVTSENDEGKQRMGCVTVVTLIAYISHRRPHPLVIFSSTTVRRFLAAGLACVASSCAPVESPNPDADSATSSAEAVVPLDTPRAVIAARAAGRRDRLSPLADTIGERMTFVARTTTVLTAATRGGRWLVDLGRIDVPTRTPERLAAYREAAALLSPVRLGDTLHVYGPWGASRTTLDGFDVWSGRIVGTVSLPAEADSLALEADRRAKAPRGVDTPFGAAVFRYPLARDSASTTIASCERVDSLTSALSARVDSVGDSLRTLLLSDTAGAAPQYRVAPRVVTSHLIGCFGGARVLVLAALRSGGDLLTRERAVLVGDDGAVSPVAVQDYRFRAHALLHTLDADGDGVDDVVARGYGRRVGSLVVFRFDPSGPALVRLTGGFAYEG